LYPLQLGPVESATSDESTHIFEEIQKRTSSYAIRITASKGSIHQFLHRAATVSLSGVAIAFRSTRHMHCPDSSCLG